MEVLLRLPVKSVIRFRCVSKSWYSFLTSSDFSTKHLQCSRRQFYLMQVDESIKPNPISPCSVVRRGNKPIYKFALAPDDDLHQLVHIDYSNPQISSMGDHKIVKLQVIGSIDGLVCISLNFGTFIIMWNPATRQSYQLPSSGVPASLFGLGRYQNNGYKVVRVAIDYRSLFSCTTEAEVYDSYSNSWHKTADPPNIPFRTDGCIIANGVPYWLSYCHLIIWFDPIHDTFGTMELPVERFERNSIYVNDVARLGVIREAVAVLVVRLNEDDTDDMALDVWMMNQPHDDVPIISWTKQFHVEAVPGVYWWLTCWKDGEFVFETADSYQEDRELYLYDHLRDETKRVPEIGCRLRAADEIFLFKESLISPHPSC